MNTPKVSVVITNYNQAAYMPAAISAALAQEYENLEVIVADDGSTDASAEAIRPFLSDPRLRLCRNPRNLKRVGNYRNALFNTMTGEWGMVVDGDDNLIDPTYIAKAMAEIANRPQVVLAFGGCRMTTPDNRFKDVVDARAERHLQKTGQEWLEENGFEYFLRWGIFLGPPHQSCLYRRDLAMQLDFYRYDILSADWESMRQLVLHGNVLIYARVAANWLRHDQGANNTMDVQQRIDDLKSINEPYTHGLALGLDGARLGAWREKTLTAYVLNNIRASILAGRVDCARGIMEHMRKTEPAVYQKCVRGLAKSPKLWAMFALLKLGGKQAANAPSAAWQKLTWKKMEISRKGAKMQKGNA